MKQLALLATFLALPLMGCATVTDLVKKVIPDIEAGVGKEGAKFSVNVDALDSLASLCLEEDGKVKGFFEKIPVVGDALVDAVGVCAPEEAPTAN